MYKEALELILDVEPEDVSDEEDEEEEEDEDEDDDEMQDGVDAGYRRGAAAERRHHLRMASDLSMIESSAEMLYGLIHQRFITSRTGIQQMAEKYDMGHFGQCPRVYCNGAKVLPVGCSDIPGQETVKLFCPSCLDVYTPPNSRFQTVDGAFFGTTFGCLFFMTFPELNVGGPRPPPPPQIQETAIPAPVASSSSMNGGANGPQSNNNNNTSRSLSSSLTSQPQLPAQTSPQQTTSNIVQIPPQPDYINGMPPRNIGPGLGPGNIYEPRIYGFRVSEFAKTGPRMKWLRSRPMDITELDECRLWEEAQPPGTSEIPAVQGQEMQQQQQQGLAADSEMIDQELDEDEELDDAEEVEIDENADLGDEGQLSVKDAKLRDDATQRNKGSRRRDQHADPLPNGTGGGTAVRVGDGDGG